MGLNDTGRMVEKWYYALENKYPICGAIKWLLCLSFSLHHQKCRHTLIKSPHNQTFRDNRYLQVEDIFIFSEIYYL